MNSIVMDPPEAVAAAAGTPRAKPRRRWLKRLGYVALALTGLALISHFVWVGSGDNQWKLAREHDGIKVYTRKAPGAALLQVRGETRLKSRLAPMVDLLENVSNCSDAYCYDAAVIDRVPSVPNHFASYVTYKFKMPGLAPRQYVLFVQHAQDPVSKEMTLSLTAAPNRVPRDPCCVRVTHLNNFWTFVPHPDGALDVSLTQDTDLGGLPYPMANLGLIESTDLFMKMLPELMAKDKFRNVQVDGVLEATQGNP